MERQSEGDGREGDDGERRLPTAFPGGTLGLVISAAVLGAIAVLITLSGLTSVGNAAGVGDSWPPSRLCVPFLTCQRAPPEINVRHGVALNRISYQDLLAAVKPFLPSSDKDGMATIPGSPTLERRPTERGPPKLIPSLDPHAETFVKILGPQAETFFDRQLLDPASRSTPPYSAIGQLRGEVTCTAVLVGGPSLILTADHCLPWDSTDKATWAAMEFIPAYDAAANPPSPYGSANVVACVGIDSEEIYDGRDVAICWLEWPIGSPALAGWLGYSWATDNDVDPFYKLGQWNGGVAAAWTSVGYPGSTNGGNSPAVKTSLAVTDVSGIIDGGMLLSTVPYVEDGWSGGPIFGLNASSNGKPYVVGVVMGWAGNVDGNSQAAMRVAPRQSHLDYLFGDTALHTAGMRPAALITYGKINTPYTVSQVDSSPH